MTALGKHWHVEHFVCAKVSISSHKNRQKDKKPRFHFHLTKRRKDGGDFEGFVIFSARSLSLETGTTRGKVSPIVRLTTTRYLCKIIILEMFFISITYQYIYLSETHYHQVSLQEHNSISIQLEHCSESGANNSPHSCLATFAKCATKLSRLTSSPPSIR